MTIDDAVPDEGPRPKDVDRPDEPAHGTHPPTTDGEGGKVAQPGEQPSAEPSGQSTAEPDAADPADQNSWWVHVLTAAGVLAAGAVLYRRGGRKKAAALIAAATPAAKATQELLRQAAEKAERGAQVAREFDALDYAYQSAAMDKSVIGAFRRHQHWTPEELAVLADPAKTALEKALELRRTFYGVKTKAIQMGFSSKPPL